MMTPQLNLIVLRSPDIDRAAAFYQALGLNFHRHAHGSGPEHLASEVNGFVFEIYPQTAKSAPTTGARIGFRVDSVDEVVKALSEIGAAVVTAPADSEWGRRAVVKDFDGHTVELVTPKNGNPGIGMNASEIAAIVKAELEKVQDPRKAALIKSLLVPIRCEQRPWDYGIQPRQTYPCWIVAEHPASNSAFAYCTQGFGPRCPWGLIWAAGEHLNMGMDSGWFSSLEDAVDSSWASENLPGGSAVKQ
jgi:lactoylglutathione lyase